MSPICQTFGRDFCVRGGKRAAIFVDVDGTISEFEPIIQAARAHFAYLMSMLGFNSKHALETVFASERAITPGMGFKRDRFPTAFVNAYKTLCKEKGARPRKHVIGICQALGHSPYFVYPTLFEDAAVVLADLPKDFLVIAVTIGDTDVQNFKIDKAGLANVFDEVIVTPIENKAELVREAIEHYNIDPKLSVFIGNSKGTDGATLAVTNFLYLPLEPGWAGDKAVLPETSEFTMWTAKNWREAQRIIQRLVAMRQWSHDHAPEAPVK